MHRNIFLLLITFSLTSSAVAQEHTLELTLEETIVEEIAGYLRPKYDCGKVFSAVWSGVGEP